jgi:hypothetical protein
MAQRTMAGFGIGGDYHTDMTRRDIVPERLEPPR